MTVEMQLIQESLKAAFGKEVKVEGLEKLLEKPSKAQADISKQIWADSKEAQQKIVEIQSGVEKVNKVAHEMEGNFKQASNNFGREAQQISPLLLQRYPDLLPSTATPPAA